MRCQQADELRQMIDGKLSEAGREVLNVQVVLTSAQPTCEFSLEDEEGKFLTIPAAEPETGDDHPRSEHSESEESSSKQEIDALKEENQTLHDRVSHLESKLEEEKRRFRELWRTNCLRLAEYDAVISDKDSEIEELKQLWAHTESSPPPEPLRRSSPGGDVHLESACELVLRTRRGKAPPVDSFTGEDLKVHLDDWLPSLERARLWNDWTEDESCCS